MRIAFVSETLWGVFDALKEYYPHCKALDEYMHTGGISYGATWRGDFPMERHNGRFTKAYLHVTIERTMVGRYRWSAYVL